MGSQGRGQAGCSGLVSALGVLNRHSGEPHVGPDENSPIFGQSEQSLKSKKCPCCERCWVG